jgi:hypothetical protein
MKRLILLLISCFSFSFISAQQGRLKQPLIPLFRPDYTSEMEMKDLDNDGDPDLLYSTLLDSILIN